jgi:hypothetical protein
MALNEDPEKAPVPEPSTGSQTPVDEEKPATPLAGNDHGSAFDKEISVEPIHTGSEDDIEKQQHVSRLCLLSKIYL